MSEFNDLELLDKEAEVKESLHGSILITDDAQIMQQAFIDYAMSVITDRALPDLRDGLKPVHRRILFAMHEAGNDHNKAYRKSARTVGDVIGKYHPHGDCLHADTKVYLENGDVRTIEDLYKEGVPQQIFCYDPETGFVTTAIAHSFRIGQYSNLNYRLILSNGEMIEATGNHRFYIVGAGWVKAEEIVAGSELLSYSVVKDSCDTSIIRPLSCRIEKTEEVVVNNMPMYDFTVNTYENMLIMTSDSMLHVVHNSSVYGAAVRMAQPFSLAVPLIDGQGNFGSIDGDSPAAMRYTEMRLERIATEMFTDLHKETIEWEPNYDGQELMPKVLTAPYPNLIVNGVEGIAVGMACSVPPHNLSAVCQSAITLIDQGDLSVKEMIDILQGPDFPTGGLVYGLEGFSDAIEKGYGRLNLRSKYEIETRSRGATRLVITEIPYMVNKAKLVMAIAELVKNKTIEDIVALRDESNKDGIRIAIDIKAEGDAEVIFATLCKMTEMEVSINYNSTLLHEGRPVQMGMLDILKHWLTFRQDVVVKRYIYDRKKAQARQHILSGLLKALGRLDEVIQLIRDADNAQDARDGLVALLEIDESQAQAILDMRLQKLTGLEIEDIHKEHDEITALIAKLTDIIESPEKILAIIRQELVDISSRYGKGRRTEIGHGIESITREDLIERENVLIAVTRNGYVKRMKEDALIKQNRGGRGKKAMDIGDDDEVSAMYAAHSHDTLMVFAQSGQVYGIKAYQIPESALTTKGRHIRNVIDGLNEEIAAIVNVPEQGEGKSIIVITSDGTVKRSALDVYDNATRKGGVKGLNLEDGNTIVGVFICQSHDHIMMISSDGNAIRFEADDVRDMGRTATGVRGMNLNTGEKVIGAYVIEGNGQALPLYQVERERNGETVTVEEPDTRAMDEGKYLTCIGEKGVGKRTPVNEFGVQSRGGKGVRCFVINGKTGRLVSAFGATLENDLIMFASNGVSNRISVESIRETGRSAAGVILMNLDAGSVVASVALAMRQEAELET
jgi:DNA gyrase subunit A